MNVRRIPCLLFACAAAASAAAPLRPVEGALEVRAEQVVLPSGPLSTLVVTPCSGCPPLSLLSTASTGYFLGRQSVPLDELRRSLSPRPMALLIVLYDRRTRELRRLQARAP